MYQKVNHEPPTAALYGDASNLTYVLYKPHPNAHAVDALSLVWKQFTFYCFPPFSCITECLKKINKEERRERRSPDSILLVDPTILLPAVTNAKTGTNDNPSKCKKSVQSG